MPQFGTIVVMPISSVRIRKGGVDDLDKIMQIMDMAFDKCYGEWWSRDQCIDLMVMPGVDILLSEDRDEDGAGLGSPRPTGFAITRTVVDETEIMLIAVLPSDRRRGTGEALIRQILDDAKGKNVRALYLEVRVNNDAKAVYQRIGFTMVGKRLAYYHGSDGARYDAETFRYEFI